MHGLLKCNIDAGVHARGRILGNLKKSVSGVENLTPNEKGRLSGQAEARRICTLRAPHVMGGRWKSHHKKIVQLSSLCQEPLNSKVIKSFVPKLRSRKCFSCFAIPMFYVYMLWTFYVHFTYPYHRYGTSRLIIFWILSDRNHRQDNPQDFTILPFMFNYLSFDFWLINQFYWHVNQDKVILCWELKNHVHCTFIFIFFSFFERF